jgi:UDP-glucuronate 4-epimerase
MARGSGGALVTGCAGFIGSHLVEGLLARGLTVTGVDALTPYYDTGVKRANLAAAAADPAFRFVEVDLRTAPLAPLLDDVDVVFHLAAQPGVRASWADGFVATVDHNLLGTQRLLEAVRDRGVDRFVHASSSSVYGDVAGVMHEDAPTHPHSPYGVTKLAAEQLCATYAANWDVPTVALRYFTVYGPRQRPDMAMHRIVEAALTGVPFPVFGDGRQRRDVTYVGDVVAANLATLDRDLPGGTVVNVAGGSIVSLREVIALVEDVTGREVPLDVRGVEAGDVRDTAADLARVRDLLGWRAEVSLADGVRRQVAWHRERLVAGARAPS